MKISEREEYLETHPDVEQVITSSPIQIDGHKLSATKKKTTSDFSNRLQEIKKFHGRHSTIRTHNITET
jgi:hypothetical protein